MTIKTLFCLTGLASSFVFCSIVTASENEAVSENNPEVVSSVVEQPESLDEAALSAEKSEIYDLVPIMNNLTASATTDAEQSAARINEPLSPPSRENVAMPYPELDDHLICRWMPEPEYDQIVTSSDSEESGQSEDDAEEVKSKWIPALCCILL